MPDVIACHKFVKGGVNSKAVEALLRHWRRAGPVRVWTEGSRRGVHVTYLSFSPPSALSTLSALDLTLPQEFLDLDATLQTSYSPDAGRVSIPLDLDGLQVYILFNPHNALVRVMAPGAHSASLVQALGAPPGFAPAGGRLEDGTAWQFEPEGSKGEGGLLSFKSSFYHQTARLHLRGNVSGCAALVEACQSGRRAAPIAELGLRLGAGLRMSDRVLTVPAAVRAYDQSWAETRALWTRLPFAAYQLAGLVLEPDELRGCVTREGFGLSPLSNHHKAAARRVEVAAFVSWERVTGSSRLNPVDHPLSCPEALTAFTEECASKIPAKALKALRG